MHWKTKLYNEKWKNSDYYYLSNRKMIEVVFSSRVSLLAFYFEESFTAHKWFFAEEKDKAGSAKGINLGMWKSIY